jgi:RND family efflux transporter MFP subunit
VKVQIARATAVRDTTEYVATLKSRDSAVIMPEVDGRVTEMYVHSGDRVSPGIPLMQIAPRRQEATVNSQEHAKAAQQANLQWAEEQYKRTHGLYAAGVMSKQDLDQARSAFDAAEAQLKALDPQVREQQVQLHYYSVVARTAGIVSDIPIVSGTG